MNKNAPNRIAAESAQDKRYFTRAEVDVHFSLRELLIINSLIERPRTRKELDDLADTSNSPNIIHSLRKKGLVIPLTRVWCLDRYGYETYFGRYSMTNRDLRYMANWFFSNKAEQN